MGLGRELSDEFKVRCKIARTKKEVDLFRLLVKSFNSLRSYDIAEVHGKKAIVEYVEDQGWFTKTPRCELGDIFFSYIPHQGKKQDILLCKIKCSVI